MRAPAVVLTTSAILLAACSEAPTRPDATAPTAQAVRAQGRSDRHIILLKAGKEAVAADASFQTAVQGLGARVERVHSEIGVLTARGLSDAAAARLASRSDVEAVVKDKRVQWLLPPEQRVSGVRRMGLRSDSDQRDAVFFDQFQWNLRRIRADDAWLVTNQGRGTTVCILDTGIDPRHIDLAGKILFGKSASFVASEPAVRDFYFHGTAMAAVVSSNGRGVASVAPDARLCSIKVLDRTGSGTFADVVAGILYAAFVRADVANMSFGDYADPRNPQDRALIALLQRAINFSTQQGVLFVASAGNDARNLNTFTPIHIPSELDNVISVGATGPINQRNFDRIASYSNYGRAGVDVFAPGGEFAFARNVLADLILSACSPSASFIPQLRVCRTSPDFYVFSAGTSPAAAHVSGEAAVIEAQLPGNQSPAELTACILRTADPLPNPLLTANGRINVLRGARCGAPKGAAAVVARN